MSPIVAGIEAFFVFLVIIYVDQKFGDRLEAKICRQLVRISASMIRQASRSLPDGQRDILEAWEAELQEHEQAPVAMLLLAWRISRDRDRILYEAEQAEHAPLDAGQSKSQIHLIPAALQVKAARTIAAIVSALVRFGRKLGINDVLPLIIGYVVAILAILELNRLILRPVFGSIALAASGMLFATVAMRIHRPPRRTRITQKSG
jgi:hypothetical protein